MSNMTIKKDGRKVTLEFTLSDKPLVSNTEAAKAAKEGRDAIAKALFSSGGFVPFDGGKVSVNVITG